MTAVFGIAPGWSPWAGWWARAHGRSLTEAEQYAAVKMRLFQAFDEIENMMADGRELRLDASAMEELLAGLGVA